MKTTLRLDDELYRLAKEAAANEGISLNKLVEDALRERLASQASQGTKKLGLRLRLPVSKATGGLCPPFVSLEEAIEAADLEYDRRTIGCPEGLLDADILIGALRSAENPRA